MADFSYSMPVRLDVLTNSEDKSSIIGLISSTIKFSQDVVSIEIANNSSSATIFLDISGGTATLSTGIPIYPKQYYSADKKVKKDVGISLISNEINADVRVIGHFNFEAEK